MMVIDLSGRRSRLMGAVLDAAGELLPRGYPEDMIWICAGNLAIQLEGDPEDDPLCDAISGVLPSCSDEKIAEWINNPASLEFELFVDLRESWQGFNRDEEPIARHIVETITHHFVEEGRK